MEWKNIDGYKYPYRISEYGEVQMHYHGKWKTLTPYSRGQRRPVVHMHGADGKRRVIPVTRLMANAWMGGVKPGYAVVHKNGSKLDFYVRNLAIIPRREASKLAGFARRRAVLKIDRNGNVVQIYKSGAEAAKKNHISKSAIQSRCAGNVRDPYRLDGYDYRYDEPYKRRSNQ